jgi:hypothetical protein
MDSRQQVIENIRGLCKEGRQFAEAAIVHFVQVDGDAIEGGRDEDADNEARREFNYCVSQIFGDFRAILRELEKLQLDEEVAAAAEE